MCNTFVVSFQGVIIAIGQINLNGPGLLSNRRLGTGVHILIIGLWSLPPASTTGISSWELIKTRLGREGRSKFILTYMYSELVLFPSLPTVQFFTDCSMQKQRGRPGSIHHVNDVNVYLHDGRQRGGVPEQKNTFHACLVLFPACVPRGPGTRHDSSLCMTNSNLFTS